MLNILFSCTFFFAPRACRSLCCCTYQICNERCTRWTEIVRRLLFLLLSARRDEPTRTKKAERIVKKISDETTGKMTCNCISMSSDHVEQGSMDAKVFTSQCVTRGIISDFSFQFLVYYISPQTTDDDDFDLSMQAWKFSINLLHRTQPGHMDIRRNEGGRLGVWWT